MTREDAEYNNQTAKFWLLEEPEILQTERNTLRYYPKAQRLVVHLSDYVTQSGETRPGKGTGLNLEALQCRPEIIDRLIEILAGLKT